MLRATHIQIEHMTNPVGIDTRVPQIGWRLGADERDVIQRAYRIQVARDPAFERLLWDTGRVESDRSICVEYAGEALASRQRCHCRVRVWDNRGGESDWSVGAYFEMGLLDEGDWSGSFITADGAVPESCPLLRRTFHVRGAVKSARLYATALGLYEAHLNGHRVGDAWLTPGWTSYRHQLQVQTYDVTDMLRQGENALGLMLGNGWYKGDLRWDNRRAIFGDTRAALVQLCIEYESGEGQIVETDDSWKAHAGPILMSELYHGETYDARLEWQGWNSPDFDDASWPQVQAIEHDKSLLVAQIGTAVRIMEELPPVALIHTPAGETVIDMGQNMVGWLRLRIMGEPGARVTLQHAEVLDKDGNFYIDNLRSARQTITYICRGGMEEVFEPHFTFQGFRYVKVTEYPGDVRLDGFIGCVIYTDMPSTGTFACSDPLLNQLQHNIVWGQKGNFVDVPTDCPQRDERLGWTGDAQVFIRTAIFNMNVAPFFRKWLCDLRLDQHADGGVPFVIPDVELKGHSSAAWGDAATICPWTLYLCYGDSRFLADQYESMKAWVEYIRRQGDDEHLWNTGFHFGDWLALDAKEGSYIGATPRDLVATAFYAHSTHLLAEAAAVLGKEQDAHNYGSLHESIVGRFQEEFVTATGRIASPTQTAHALALMFDLVKEEHRSRTAATLANMIEENQFRLTTGFVGTPYLCEVLTKNGYHEIACKLVRQTEYPSWLYSVNAGATTIWEHWDGIKPDGSFWSPDMNSFNHYAYGSIGDWLYRVLAGLDTDPKNPGYKRILIQPHPDPALEFAQTSHESPYGLIRSAWRRDPEGLLHVEAEIPANTTASVMLPGARLADIQEGGALLGAAVGVGRTEETDEGVRVEVGSGVYRFSYPA